MGTEGDLGLSYVGAPDEVFRAVDPKYADQARQNTNVYLTRTLGFNQRSGGRYNAPGEFGALYTASDEATAWSELHARFLREGVQGLPPRMGMIRITIRSGQYADFGDAHVRDLWDVQLSVLQAESPTQQQQEECWRIGREVRVVADFLAAPSARAAGTNIPLFVAGREGSELVFDIAHADSARPTPVELRQSPTEVWE